MGNRFSANTEEPTILEFEFKKDSVLINPFSINKVTLHRSTVDAQNNTNIIETITSPGILNTGVGCYSYTAAVLTSTGMYYDKVFVTPTLGASELSFTNSFSVAAISYTGNAMGVPANSNLCRVSGRTVDSNGNAIGGMLVFCRPWAMPGTVQNSLIAQIGVSATSDSKGYFYIDLFKNIEFIFTIKELGVHSIVKIPDKSTWTLTSLMASEPTAPPSNPGDTNW